MQVVHLNSYRNSEFDHDIMYQDDDTVWQWIDKVFSNNSSLQNYEIIQFLCASDDSQMVERSISKAAVISTKYLLNTI